ncbi:MAG: low temperature requirement protein A [Solirubrobacterales bacterium]|nr:low temperature requirement protein A [Solirubrobacterales bacterium]
MRETAAAGGDLAPAGGRPVPAAERDAPAAGPDAAAAGPDAPAGKLDVRSGEERRTSPLELLWDLVFVFAVTQVTSLLSNNLTPRGFGRAMLALALIWWAWSAFVWATNAQTTTARSLRVCLLVATVFIFITGLALPRAFGDQATLFAVSYAVVRGLHLALYADASRKGNASWSAIAGFAVTVAIGMALLIGGSFLDGVARDLLWLAAVAIDYAGPAWLTRERLRGLQRVAVAHFAERYGLFVIICLGESIVAIGVSSRGEPISAALVAAVSLGLLITVALWWTYFDRFAEVAEERLREHPDPVLVAADAYSYLHLVIVAGIIVFAVGVHFLALESDRSLPDGARLCLCGGLALYLLGHVAFRLRIAGTVGYEKLIVAVLLILLYALGPGLSGWTLAAIATALLAGLCTAESDVLPRPRATDAGVGVSHRDEQGRGASR